MRFVLTSVGCTSQIAFGACVLRSFTIGGVKSLGKVMSNSPATKARTAVERFFTMVKSMPSR